MKRFEGTLICSDLDGTLLRNDNSISQDDLKAIEYYKANGGLFTFISGRSHLSMSRFYDEVQPNVPVGCCDGSGIYDFKNKEFIWMALLLEEAKQLIRCVDEQLPMIGLMINTSKNSYFCKSNSTVEKVRKLSELPNTICHYEEVKEPILNVVFIEENEEFMQRLMKLLASHPKAAQYDFIRSDQCLYEMLPKGANKQNAMLKIAEYLKQDIKNTIAVGNYDNDVSMIQVAGKGYAVANACHAAKVAADCVTVSNQESVIARIIEELEKSCLK